jgi:hypothetical protein
MNRQASLNSMIYIEVFCFWEAWTISFVDFTSALEHFAATQSASAHRDLHQWRRP